MPTRVLAVATFLALIAFAQAPKPDPNRPDPNKPNTNYDESKVGTYTLPDPLVLANGDRVRDPQTWMEKRRPEIFRAFEAEFYGRSPERPRDLHWEVTESGRWLDGKAIRKQVTVYFSAKKDGPRENILIYLPADAKGPVPVFLCLNFTGNQRVSSDPAIELPMLWNREHTQQTRAPESSRADSPGWPVEKILARGYGLATIFYQEIDPDFAGGLPYGVRALYLKPGQTEPAPDEWGTISAWGWGLSRAMDYLETDRAVDAKRVGIVGYSRLGKTVLWAGARDTRFAAVFAGGSGEGGAALARRNYGETVKDMNARFLYQFAKNHAKYDDPSTLPFDSHELLALLAPRPFYLATAEEDRWSDPRGEFLAAIAAGPVYKLFGKHGLDTDQMPAVGQSIMRDIGIHYRPGKHEQTAYEWDQYLAFADMRLKDHPLPGAGLAQHPFLYCGEWQAKGKTDQIMHLVRDGKVVWTYAIPGREELGDCTRLSNGNIVFSRRFGASEVTPDKKIVWNYEAPPKTEIHTTYPLGLDRVLLMQNGNPAKLLVIHKASGRIEKELVLPTRVPDGIHGQFRHVRVTNTGTFLVAHLDLGKVVEYDQSGKEIWSVPAPSAWGAVRLKNGNTLISGNQHGYVREVNPRGEIVWEVKQFDLPGITLETVQEVDRLSSGNTVICNWVGGVPLDQWSTVVQVVEVTPDKKVVWALRDWKNLGPASSIQLLDEPGVPEKGELQR
jgi:hypothetical protein